MLRILDRLYRSRLDPKNRVSPVIIVVDEALLYLDSQKFKDLPDEFNAFLVQLRKMGVFVYLVTQRYLFINMKFRRICGNVRLY